MSKLLKIGDISKLCNISIKTLRYYEEMGLIKPVEVDIYSGYRYYDEKNIEDIYRIQLLKELGMPLKEIRDFDNSTLAKRRKEISKEIKNLRAQRKLIDSLINQKGEKIMKPFIEDKEVVGKWTYVGSALSKEGFKNGDTVKDDDILFQEIYFLPNGEGYWVFDRWSKGEVYHFQGIIYPYEIEDGKLYLSIYNADGEFQIVCVYEKVDSKEYTENEIRHKDDIALPFVLDEKALGSWSVIDFISIQDKENYMPREKEHKGIFNSISLLANGDCFKEFANGNIVKNSWTAGYIISAEQSLASNFIIKEIDGESYLIMDWKSGDYVYGGEIFGCYVFKKQA